MKLTKQNILKLKEESNNKLYKKVCSWVLNQWSQYDDKVAIFRDVLDYGCINGMVSELIYYNDTTKFYNQYKNEINDLYSDLEWETHCDSPSQLFGSHRWDEEDPSCLGVYNQNQMAWFGFEETLRIIANEFGID